MSWERHPRHSKAFAAAFNTVLAVGGGTGIQVVEKQKPRKSRRGALAEEEVLEEEEVEEEPAPKRKAHEHKHRHHHHHKHRHHHRSHGHTDDDLEETMAAAAAAGDSEEEEEEEEDAVASEARAVQVKRPKTLLDTIPAEVCELGDADSWRFVYIHTNAFFSRERRRVRDEDAPVCSCVLIYGEPGCVPFQCLNRITNTECVPHLCPCGVTCSNQRFQSRQYAAVAPFRTRDKGWGLMALETIQKGQFVIEYVGEVIQREELERRLEDYAARRTTQHIYFLMLTNDEAIDASRCGNLARFINHSCDPNTETGKWNVLGELCIGIFAKRRILAGSEITFDYQFQRFGGEPQPCHCGAKNCRRFIGGEPPSRRK